MAPAPDPQWRASSWPRESLATPPSAAPEPDLVLSEEVVAPPEPAVAEAEPEPVAVEPEPVAEPEAVVPEPEPEPVAEPVAEAPAVVAAPAPEAATGAFFAGAGVKMKAEVSACDVFHVDGEFDGTVSARRLVIGAGGTFKGTANVHEAEIGGRFDGTLTAGDVLVVRATGRVQGNVTYGQLEIERGGHLQGGLMVKGAQERVPEVAPPAVAAPEPVRVSAPRPVIVPRAAPPAPPASVEPTPAPVAAPRKAVLPPLSFGAKKN